MAGEVTTPTPPGGGVVGDPYILRPDGTKYKFAGAVGMSYNYLSDSNFRVAFRIAAVPGSTTETYNDRITITYSPPLGIGTKYTVVVDLNAATCNGVALVKGGAVLPFATGSVKYWVGAGGEDRVDVSYGGYKVAVIQDPGTAVMHSAGPLKNVKHLGLFVDAMPSGMNLLNCIFLNGGPNISVLPFLITL